MMIRLISLLAVMAICCTALVACGGGGPSLVGKWMIDVDAYTKQIEADTKKDEETKKAELAMLKDPEMAKKMTIEITATEVKMGDKVSKYKIVKTEGNVLTIESTDDKGKTETVKMEVNGDSMAMIKEDGSKGTPMKRVK
ncbi:MAG: hypothetical protein AB7K09_12845 [Planctomycetota bacterium]